MIRFKWLLYNFLKNLNTIFLKSVSNAEMECENSIFNNFLKNYGAWA